MMKKINLPTTSTDSVDLASVNTDIKGVIIAYKGTSSVGFIYFDAEYWYYADAIDIQEGNVNDCTLLGVINYLVKNKIADNFKLIEFV